MESEVRTRGTGSGAPGGVDDDDDGDDGDDGAPGLEAEVDVEVEVGRGSMILSAACSHACVNAGEHLARGSSIGRMFDASDS